MAAQNEGRTEQDQQSQQTQGGKTGKGGSGTAAGSGASSGMSGSTSARGAQSGTQAEGHTGAQSGTHAAPQADQERPMPTSREQGARQTGQAMAQRGQQRGQTGLARQQPSILPALFAAPPGVMAGAFLADPFEFMNRLSDEMDNWFSGAGGGTAANPTSAAGGRGLATRGRSWMPNIETFQRGNDLVVRADVPGIPKQDLDISVNEGVLTISGERRSAQSQGQQGQGQQAQGQQGQGQQQSQTQQGGQGGARSAMSFYEAIQLPEGVNEDQISATCEHGVLEITIPLPQQQQQKGRKIQVQ